MLGRIAILLFALVLGLGAAACGGDDEGAGTDTTTEDGETSFAAGRTVFIDNCGACHTLSDAGTTGTVGPSLDGTSLSVDAVQEQVRNGGGAMPAFEGTLGDDEIENVSEYVVEAAGG